MLVVEICGIDCLDHLFAAATAAAVAVVRTTDDSGSIAAVEIAGRVVVAARSFDWWMANLGCRPRRVMRVV